MASLHGRSSTSCTCRHPRASQPRHHEMATLSIVPTTEELSSAISPDETHTLKQFHLFKELPVEIRLQIWRLTLPQEHLSLEFMFVHNESYSWQIAENRIRGSLPVALQVNQEARHETLRRHFFHTKSNMMGYCLTTMRPGHVFLPIAPTRLTFRLFLDHGTNSHSDLRVPLHDFFRKCPEACDSVTTIDFGIVPFSNNRCWLGQSHGDQPGSNLLVQLLPFVTNIKRIEFEEQTYAYGPYNYTETCPVLKKHTENYLSQQGVYTEGTLPQIELKMTSRPALWITFDEARAKSHLWLLIAGGG